MTSRSSVSRAINDCVCVRLALMIFRGVAVGVGASDPGFGVAVDGEGVISRLGCSICRIVSCLACCSAARAADSFRPDTFGSPFDGSPTPPSGFSGNTVGGIPSEEKWPLMNPRGSLYRSSTST
uniref:Putative secreted protein n=1 Tax=Anopheles marajoara TaxID=58244 RepID=A0A2M4C761_9DIPT